MGLFAVIDTETNWLDEVMSVGVAVSGEEKFGLEDARYYILSREASVGGMYDGVLELPGKRNTVYGTRREVMKDLNSWLMRLGVQKIFAYNACFDKAHLPELSGYAWYDIMRIAAYRQYNAFIPADAPCCRTGRLRSRYGVEAMTRLLTGDRDYRETHNALYDAADELQIMKKLGRPLSGYEPARLI